ncbi:UDP-glycosyltransferase 89B2 [Vitis vinifera]|uniref:UDP-glycosyltransferase 89B2 n=1 Tax=Vitis vinifera TaxID=29760 RepID=A0A438JYZ5_VITVI|nr:UDP-glycosyltransferase 89B2 [Vitis vinifera]
MTALDSGAGAHVLVFPFPSQGHMILSWTSPINSPPAGYPSPSSSPHKTSLSLTLFSPKHPSHQNPSLAFSAAPFDSCRRGELQRPVGQVLRCYANHLGELYNPIVDWFRTHPSPPVAIISDMFLGWTQQLACELGIHRVVFSPSGAMSLSAMYSLWRDLPKIEDPPI